MIHLRLGTHTKAILAIRLTIRPNKPPNFCEIEASRSPRAISAFSPLPPSGVALSRIAASDGGISISVQP